MNVRSISGADLSAISLLQDVGQMETSLFEHHFAMDNDGLNLQFQTCQFPGVVVTHLSGSACKNSTLVSEDPSPSVSMNFQLNGSVSSDHLACGNFQIHAAQHNLLYASYGAGRHTFLKGNVQALHFRMDTGYFYKLLAGEELVNGIIEKTTRKNSFFANASMMPVVPDMAAALKAVMNCPLKGQFKKVYLEGKMMELLALELAQAAQYRSPVKTLSAADTNKIHEVRDFLDIHFLLPLSLLSLARQFGLNDYKLKKGFRDIFQTTVFSYIHQKRMALSLKLLSEKAVTIAEVADTIGYQNANHFSSAFKKFFGFVPGSVR